MTQKKKNNSGWIVKLVKDPPVILDADINEVIKDYDSIAHIVGRQGYTRVHTKDGKCMEFPVWLKYFEDRLPGDLFLRTDKSHIVNTNDVKRLFPQSGKTIAVMNSLDQVPVMPDKTDTLEIMMLRNKQDKNHKE